jgi:hypothetical protein
MPDVLRAALQLFQRGRGAGKPLGHNTKNLGKPLGHNARVWANRWDIQPMMQWFRQSVERTIKNAKVQAGQVAMKNTA